MKTVERLHSVSAQRTIRPALAGLAEDHGWAQTARKSGATVLLSAVCLLLGGCTLLPEAQPDLTRYYVLTSVAPESGSGAAAAEGPRVFLRGLSVPEFLRGRVMPVRVSENELQFVDEARWAEPLEAGLLRVLRENLERSAAARVVSRAGEAHAFDVVLQLRRCEGVLPAGSARLAVRIELFTTDLDPELVAQEEFTSDIPGWDGQDHADLAKKLSAAAAQLGRRIAELIPAG